MSNHNFIRIKHARQHNLKNISLDLPKEKLIVFTGLSGSGKSSLAFDTIFAEGQRRYIESLSPYARQFLGQMKRPDVEEIEGLSPAIAISQKALSANPRSTVATLTEIYDYLRVLFARVGHPHCPKCGREIRPLSIQEMLDIIEQKSAELRAKEIIILSPLVLGRKGEYYQLLYDCLNQGFDEARIDGEFCSLHERIELSRYKQHTIEIVVDKFYPPHLLKEEVKKMERSRWFEAVETALDLNDGLINVLFYPSQSPLVKGGNKEGSETPLSPPYQLAPQKAGGGDKGEVSELLLSSRRTCPQDNFSFPEIEPRLFSFNSPYGACPACGGLGKENAWSEKICPECQGKRLRPEALAVKISGKNIDELTHLSIKDSGEFFENLLNKLTSTEYEIALNLLAEITARIKFLRDVGLNYLTLNREAGSLSGGEAQRIRLASQIGSKLSGTLYVLDEPTIGLHPRDTEKLLNILKELKESGNTVIVVEHDEETIRQSDWLVDLGPRAGKHGGEIMAQGETKKLLKSNSPSLTIRYLQGKEKIDIPEWRQGKREKLTLVNCQKHNLQNIKAEIPMRALVCITGVSGSGKSTLFNLISKNVFHVLNRKKGELKNISQIKGVEYLSRVLKINQSPIGRSPRSNPATYTGIFTPIRELFASLEEAREKGYGISRFSFNRPGGRCEACEGAGFRLVEMHFLPPVLVECEICRGKRFNSETLEVKYKGKNIAEILELTVDEAYELFNEIPFISDKLKTLKEVGLGYIQLGQSSTTLSGGEAQRIKLGRELNRQMAYRTLYLLDEPTVGLHYDDIKMLLKVLQKLVDKGNTVVVIEHNLHVIKSADWVIDLGPEGGDAGGRIVAQGTPAEVARNDKSYTGKYLREIL